LRPGAAARRRDLRNVRRLLIGDEHDREQALRGGSGGYVTHNSTGDPQKLLASFHAQPNGVDPDKPGIKFVIAVTSEAQLTRAELIEFEQAVADVVDAATEVRGRSMYSGFGFAHFLLMGRVDYEEFHDLNGKLVARLNAAAIREPFGVRTQTHLSAQRGYHIAQEGLSTHLGDQGDQPSDTRATFALEPDDVVPGNVIDDRFEVRARLGSGGYALVFRAYDRLERVERAVKLFRSRNPLAARREMDALRKVRHRNVVRLRHSGHDGDLWYLVFDLVEGKSLAQVDLSVLDDVRALTIIDQVLSALIALHPDDERIAEMEAHARHRSVTPEEFADLQQLRNSGLIHRDIKPGNIMVGDDGTVKLVDFNIASPARRETLTRTSTPEYCGPDAGLGGWEPSDDLYSCGVVLYELLTGKHPSYDDSEVKLPEAIDIAQRRPDLSQGLMGIVRCALSESRVDRYATAKIMQSVLRRELHELKLAGPEADRIGRRLETLRTERGMSQGELAKETGIPEREIERFETGEAVLPLADASALARALLMRLDDLISTQGDPESKSIEDPASACPDDKD